jgi:hypothetical protein
MGCLLRRMFELSRFDPNVLDVLPDQAACHGPVVMDLQLSRAPSSWVVFLIRLSFPGSRGSGPAAGQSAVSRVGCLIRLFCTGAVMLKNSAGGGFAALDGLFV